MVNEIKEEDSLFKNESAGTDLLRTGDHILRDMSSDSKDKELDKSMKFIKEPPGRERGRKTNPHSNLMSTLSKDNKSIASKDIISALEEEKKMIDSKIRRI